MRSLKKDRVLLLICENTATSTLQGIKLSPSLSRPSWSSRPIPFVHYGSIVLMTKRRWGPNPSYKWPSLLNWCEIRNIIRSRNCALRTQESYSLFCVRYITSVKWSPPAILQTHNLSITFFITFSCAICWIKKKCSSAARLWSICLRSLSALSTSKRTKVWCRKIKRADQCKYFVILSVFARRTIDCDNKFLLY